jgi:branched-chain amino acid transport system substrate-binding protein
MTFIKKIFHLSLSIVVMSFLSSCKKEEASSSFHIGFLTPKTGNDALSGQACERGAKIAQEFLKAQGINVKITIVDTESNVETARLKAQKLIQEGVHCLVGAYTSAVSAGVAEIAQKHKIPFIINLSAAEQLTEQGYEYVFRNFPTTMMFTERSVLLLNTFFKEMGDAVKDCKTATLMVLNDSYGQGMLDAFQKADAAGVLPFNIKHVLQFDHKAKDLSTEIAKAKSYHTDVLLIVSRVNTTNIIVREMINQCYEPKLIIGPANQGFLEKQFYNLFKEKSDYFYTFHTWVDLSSEFARSAQAIFTKQYPEEIFELNAGFSLEAIYIAAKAYQNAKTSEPTALKDALKNFKEEKRIMFGGPIQFDEKGQRQNLEIIGLMNKDQKPLVILPKSIRETESVFPFPGF